MFSLNIEHKQFFPRRWIIILLLLLSVLVTACSGFSTSSIEMAPLAQMPKEVQESPISVQEAYRFAVANPNVLKQIPCYCGCGAIGHTSNYACYVKEVSLSGTITFDTHALGCSICVDITQDVMRLQKNGRSLEEIQGIIDQTYSKYGSPTSLSQ